MFTGSATRKEKIKDKLEQEMRETEELEAQFNQIPEDEDPFWLRLRTPVPLGTFTNRMNVWRATRLGARAPRHRARARDPDPAPHADRRALRSPRLPKIKLSSRGSRSTIYW